MDTVIIKIYGTDKFEIRRAYLFLPEFAVRRYTDLSMTEKGSMRPYLRRFIFCPIRDDEYCPGIEVFEAFTEDRQDLKYILQITFSVPKLLYGNSLLEVAEKDMGLVFLVLSSRLSRAGVIVGAKDIANALVATVHFCKNVFLPNTIKMRDILGDLERVDINKAVDVTLKEHKNGGRVLSIFSGTVERAFYDKISDCLRPKNKRKDKNYISLEREFVESFGLQDHEVFRYEYRVKKTQTVMHEMSRALGRKYGPVYFHDLFMPGLFKRVTFDSWRALIERPENRLAFFIRDDALKLFLHIVGEGKKVGSSAHSMNKALISYGIARIISDIGAKETRGILLENWCKDHSERIERKIKMAADLVKTMPYPNGIAYIDRALEEFIGITSEMLRNAV